MPARPELPVTQNPVDIRRPTSKRLGLNAAIVVVSTLLLTGPLYLWRVSYPLTDWDLVDQHRADTKERVLQAFALKGQEIDKAIAEDFRLSEINRALLEN